MMSILLILNTCVAVALVIIILLQKTDPAAGGMFGGTGGGAQAVVRNPLAKPTAYLAAMFIVLSLAMAYVNKGAEHKTGSVMEDVAKDMAHTPAPAPADVQAGMVGPAALVAPQAATATVPVTATQAVSATLPTVSPTL